MKTLHIVLAIGIVAFSLILFQQLDGQVVGDVTIDVTNNRVVVVITGANDATTDTANFTTAVNLLNAEGGGVLGIKNTVILNTNFDFTGNVSIVGMSEDATISYVGAGGVVLSWNETWDPLDETSFGITATAGDGNVTVTSGTAPDRGDWVVLWSDDQLTGVEPHLGTVTGQHPEEMHQIEYVQDDDSQFWVNGFVVDTMSAGAAAQGVVIPSSVMDDGVVIDNVTFDRPLAEGDVTDFSYIMKFIACSNLTITDSVRTTRNSPGGVWFQYCSNVMSRMTHNGSINRDGVYAYVAGPCNAVRIDSVIRGTRHAFTTSSGLAIATALTDTISSVDDSTETLTTASAHGLTVGMHVYFTGSLPTGLTTTDHYWVESVPAADEFTVSATPGGAAVNLTSTTSGGTVNRRGRWGTPLGVIVDGLIYVSPKVDEATGSESSRGSFDTHAEGWGVICRADFIIEGGSGGDIPAQSRSRAAEFKGCTFKGVGSSTTAIRIRASDCVVDGCTIDGAWRAVLVQDSGLSSTIDTGTCTITNNLFKDCAAYALLVVDGDDHRIYNNSFENCGYMLFSSPFSSRSAIRISGGTSHEVHGNTIIKTPGTSNLHAFDFYQLDETDVNVTGNVLTGYGSGVAGFGRILDVPTVTAGSDTIDTATSHGFVSNDRVHFTLSENNLTAGTDYYVIPVDANTFSVSLSSGPGATHDITGVASGNMDVQNGSVTALEAAYDGVNTIDE